MEGTYENDPYIEIINSPRNTNELDKYYQIKSHTLIETVCISFLSESESTSPAPVTLSPATKH